MHAMPLALQYLLHCSLILMLSAQGGNAESPADMPVIEDVAAIKAAAKEWVDKSLGTMQPLLPYRDLQRGLIHFGSRERIRKAALKMLAGQKVTVAAIGGSITGGQGVADGGHPWPKWVHTWVNATRPGEHIVFHNGAVGGTTSAYMSMCLSLHVPEDADIIFVEYAINDQAHPTPVFANSDRMAMERLLRKLLRLPNKPAVVMMNAYHWFKAEAGPPLGCYWSNAEAEYLDFATYYGLSMISVKAASYKHMVAGTKGFKVDKPRLWGGEDVSKRSPGGEYFYYDEIHPDGNTGARVMGELAFMFLTDAMHSLTRSLPSHAELSHLKDPLPKPMVEGNYESSRAACWIGPKFKDGAVSLIEGFEWINEAPESLRPKWGYIAKTVGATLHLNISTRPNVNMDQAVRVSVGIAYLKSYEHMGKAMVSCISGCECEASEIDGHHEPKNSQMFTHKFSVTQADPCVVKIQVLEGTKSGEHKVKIMGVMITEQGEFGLGAEAALDYVHDISFRGNGTFSIYNHA